MTKRLLVLIFVTLGLALAVQGADKRTTQGGWVYLQNGSDLRISIETNRAIGCWTPVTVSVAGAEVSAGMDAKGRVVRNWAGGLDKRGPTLFTIDLEKGCILLGREAYAIVVYEQSPVRMRYRLADSVIPLPVRMDPTGRNGTLRFGGLEIPAEVSAADPPNASRAMKPTDTNSSPAAIRPASLAALPPVARGFGAKAHLSPSRLRTSGK